MRKSRPEFFIALLGLLVAVAFLPLRMKFPFDDTYITFRYAQNLAHGWGIVWNPGGPHTEGYTNFLYMLLLVPFSWMGSDLVNVAQLRNVIFVIITAIGIWKIVEHEARPLSTRLIPAFAVALFYLDPFTWFNAFSGMETSLFTMFIVLAIAYLNHSLHRIRRKGDQPSRWALITPFWIATLAALTRPEGALLGPILLLVILLTERERAYRAAAVTGFVALFALPLALYAIWKYWYFGNVLPNSFYVKVAQVGTFLPGRGTMRIFYTGIWYLPLIALLGVKRWKRSPGMQTAALWCILLTTFYLFSQLIQPQYGRFTNSMEVMLILLAALAINNVQLRINRKGGASPINYSLLLITCLVALHVFWAFYYRGAMGDITRETSYEERYHRVAEVLRGIPHHEEITIATPDAGILPYYSGLRHIDPVGLNTNEIAHAHSAPEVIALLLHARPDILLIPLGVSGHGLIGNSYPALGAQAQATGYRAIDTIDQEVYKLEVLADTGSRHYQNIVTAFPARGGRPPRRPQ